MRFFSFFKDLFNTYSYIKIFAPLFTIVLSIPLLKIYYWSYDASYLAAFGIAPDIYSMRLITLTLVAMKFRAKKAPTNSSSIMMRKF